MMSGGEVKSHVKSFSQGAEEVRDKLHTVIRGNMRGYTVFREDMHDEEIGQLGRGDGVMSGDEDCLLG